MIGSRNVVNSVVSRQAGDHAAEPAAVGDGARAGVEEHHEPVLMLAALSGNSGYDCELRGRCEAKTPR